MARMDVKGFDDVQRQIDALDRKLQMGAARDVLSAGAQEYVKAWKSAIGDRGHIRSGAMQQSVKITRLDEGSGGGIYATIAPDGYDSRGVANDLKLNVLGSKRDKRLQKQAEQSAEEPAKAAMQSALDRIVKG